MESKTVWNVARELMLRSSMVTESQEQSLFELSLTAMRCSLALMEGLPSCSSNEISLRAL